VAGKNGGARPGAGRKPRAEVYESAITKADRRLAKNLIPHIENMERLADGVLVEEAHPITGKMVVYQRPPDRQANEYLINRVMGKPTERQEHEHSGDVNVHNYHEQLAHKLASIAAAHEAGSVSEESDE
jgi:hypothetical protein